MKKPVTKEEIDKLVKLSDVWSNRFGKSYETINLEIEAVIQGKDWKCVKPETPINKGQNGSSPSGE